LREVALALSSVDLAADPVPAAELLATLVKVPKLKPALAVPPGRSFGVLVQEERGGALDTWGAHSEHVCDEHTAIRSRHA